MKKILFVVFSLAALLFVFPSCNNSDSPQQKMKKEKKAIEKFISQKGFEILKNYPADGVFKENQYTRTSTGLYVRVIDKGDSTKIRMNQKVNIRFREGLYFMEANSVSFTNDSATDNPIEITYGMPESYAYTYGDAWEIPLSFIGDKAKISMIVPSNLGNSSDKQYYRPVFYGSVTYRFD
ncbi:hypothetical protein AwDysgo_20560 [Bacteroidales bacterium]|nr:hypothetical protein AwDysgo_20560 [Bacteroidales bacterium]